MKTKSNMTVKDKPKELDWEKVAFLFHNTYEGLAPKFGYETRKDTKAFDNKSQNGQLMIATCKAVVSHYLTQQRTELEKKFKKDKKQPKDKLGDDFTKFLESEGYQVRDCEVEKCKHKWIQIEYDLMKCLKCNKVKKL